MRRVVEMVPQANGVNGHAPPLHSQQAEEAALGTVLGDDTALGRVGPIPPAYFTDPRHRIINDVITDLVGRGSGSDVVTVFAELERLGLSEDAGGFAYLGSLVRNTPTNARIETYLPVLRERATLRQLHERCESIRLSIEDGETSNSLIERMRRDLDGYESERPASPLVLTPASAWADRPAPTPRDFVWGQSIPAARVTSFTGDGGFGKTTVAIQIGVHVALNRPLYGLAVNGGRVLGIFCEDEQAELERRVRDICAAENVEVSALCNFIAISRDGEENLLCTFDRDRIEFSPFYQRLEATVAACAPVRLLIIDTLADVFGGDYLSTPHVRQFIKTALNGLCVRHGCAVLLVAHPSAAGINSGRGDGFSTAWNNSVRSRLYLRRPNSGDKADTSDRRVLEVMKANYGPSGVTIPLIYRAGAFIPDPEPIEESARAARAPKVNTPLAVAALDHVREVAGSGAVVTFKALYEALQAGGHLADGKPDTVRKTLQRALAELTEGGLLDASNVPRGYRLPETARDNSGHGRGQTRDVGTPGHGDIRDTPYRGGVPCVPAESVPSSDPSCDKEDF